MAILLMYSSGDKTPQRLEIEAISCQAWFTLEGKSLGLVEFNQYGDLSNCIGL